LASSAAKREGIIPDDCKFIGAWCIYLGIDDIYDAFSAA